MVSDVDERRLEITLKDHANKGNRNAEASLSSEGEPQDRRTGRAAHAKEPMTHKRQTVGGADELERLVPFGG